MDPDGEETGRLDPDPEKSQVAIGFVKHSGTDPLKKQLLPRGPTKLRGGGSPYQIFSRRRSVRPTKKYIDG